MVGRHGAFGILVGAAVGTLLLVPAQGSAQDSLSVSCADVDFTDRPPIVVPPTVLVQRPPEAWGEGR